LISKVLSLSSATSFDIFQKSNACIINPLSTTCSIVSNLVSSLISKFSTLLEIFFKSFVNQIEIIQIIRENTVANVSPFIRKYKKATIIISHKAT
jgi:hypothetical protein